LDLFLAVAGIFVVLIYSVFRGIYVFYPLLLGLVVFILLALKSGHNLKSLAGMVWQGIAKSMQLNFILFLIGAAIALWMASGTVPFLIYYSMKFINQQFFLLSVFVMTCLTSLLLGTSFGTVGTIGIVFMIISRAGHINLDLVAGAIISGAYFGEKSTPVSSSANLVAILTGTEIYDNIKNMYKASIIPFLITIVIYSIISVRNHLNIDFHSTSSEILKIFNLSWFVTLPALVMIIFIVFRIDIRLALLASISVAFAEGFLLQSRSLGELLNYVLWGYTLSPTSPLARIIQGGGLLSMVKTVLVVMVSSAYAGIFAGTNILYSFEEMIGVISRKLGLFFATTMTSIISACFGCTQTFPIIITSQFMKKLYPADRTGRSGLAADIGNTALIISPLVPWNIAGTFPAGVLAVGPGFIPYSFYLYLVPLFILAQRTTTRYMGRGPHPTPVDGLSTGTASGRPGDQPAGKRSKGGEIRG